MAGPEKNNYWNNQLIWGDWMNWGRPVNVDKTDLVWKYHNIHDNGGDYFTINGRPINRDIVTYNPFYSKEINDTVYIHPNRAYYIRTPYKTELDKRAGRYYDELINYRRKYQIAPSNSVITLHNAGRATRARVNPNLLDSIALNAGKESYPIDKALGLAVKESTLMPVADDPVKLYSNWDYESQGPYLSDIVEVSKEGRGFPNPDELLGEIIDDKKIDLRARDYAHSLRTPYKGPKDESAIRHAIRKYKTAPESYNPGLGLNYHDLVNENAVLIMRSPLIINWWNTSGNYWYNQGLQSKKKGGKMIPKHSWGGFIDFLKHPFLHTTSFIEGVWPTKKDYKNTIYINKAKQRLHYYNKDGNLVINSPVSTGAKAGNKEKEGDLKTPEGLFTISHSTNKADKLKFGDTLFYGLSYGHGIGIHGDAGSPNKLGRRASHGCIRMPHGLLRCLQDLIGTGVGVPVIIEKLGGMIYKNGGIHIKPENKGKFTSYCHGKVTQECILKGKNSSNPTIRKRATFADNARHFKHKFGGTILKYQHGNWFRNAVDNVSDAFWKFGDVTGMYDKQGVQHMFDDLSNFGITSPSSNDGTTYGIVAPSITNSVLQKIPLVGPGTTFLTVPTKWSIRSTFADNMPTNAAERAAMADFAEEFGLQTPKFGKGRPSYTGTLEGKTYDIRYPKIEVEPKVKPVRDAKKAYLKRVAEDKADNIRLNGSAKTTFKRDHVQSTGDSRHANTGRPKTKSTRDELIKDLEGSYADSYFGRLWAKTIKQKARVGYITPTIKLNLLRILEEFAKRYGYYFK